MKYFNDYSSAVDWIEGIVPHGIKPGLKRMDALLELLGHPERNLQYIHVAGTNGKGSHQLKNASVAVMALEILRAHNRISFNGLREGLMKTEWPGRLEIVSDEPRILLDGAHNPEGAQSLAIIEGFNSHKKPER